MKNGNTWRQEFSISSKAVSQELSALGPGDGVKIRPKQHWEEIQRNSSI
jgi:hypothetical protein